MIIKIQFTILLLYIFAIPALGQKLYPRYYKAEAILQQGDTSAAIAIYKKIISEYPLDFPSALRLTELTLQAGRHNQAIEYAHQAIEMLKKSRKLAEMKSLLPENNQDEIDKINQDLASVYHLLAKAEMKQNNWKAAKSDIEIAFKLYPSNDEILIDLGIIQHHQYGVDSAKVAFKKALDHNPLSHLAHYNLAKIYAHDGQDSLFQWHLNKAIMIKKDFLPAYRELARFHLKRKNYQDAARYYQFLFDLQEQSTEVVYNLAFSLLKLDQPGKAIQYWKIGLEQDSANTDILRNLSISYLQNEDYHQAAAYTKQLINQENSPEHLLLHTYALILDNQLDAGLETVRQLKNHPKGRYYQSLIYFQMGRNKKACRIFNKSLKMGFDPTAANERLRQLCQ